jgi:hypothetical protein
MLAPFAPACHQILGPSSYDANWEVFDRGRFTFYARPSSFAARSIDQLFTVLDDQYNAVMTMLDVQYAARVSTTSGKTLFRRLLTTRAPRFSPG